MAALIPQPRFAITTRPATLDDLPFMDALQKKHTKQVGWMPTKTLEGKIKAGHVLLAVDEAGERVGYLIGTDRYFKRDDVGIIYQINIAEGKRRGLVGAMLLKAQFERSAYGCKLYCCWCAQDIEANHFWEACGFVPLAFRAGSEKKKRVHIFWCKRIREGDTTTPWWFPAETKGGSIMEDRLVFPIPPNTHWSDAKPIMLPRHTQGGNAQQKQIEDARPARKMKPSPAIMNRPTPLRGLTFQSPAPAHKTPTDEKPKRQRKEKIKNDPKFVSAARELRDRWLEQVNGAGRAGAGMLEANGKYALTRQIEDATKPQLLLPAA